MFRLLTPLILLCCFSSKGFAGDCKIDPLDSPSWEYMQSLFLEGGPCEFDERIKVEVPDFAEDAFQVPISVDASSIKDIVKIVAFSDLNPIPHIFNYFPESETSPRVSLRIKVQQSTPVRAAVLTKDGKWHVGGSFLNAAGGGCTAPSVGNGNPYWEDHLGEIKSKAFSLTGSKNTRLKFKVIHPMDTGLASSIPEFYIEQVQLRGSDRKPIIRMELSQPVSENPVISFDMEGNTKGYSLWMRDNSGNEFENTI